MDGENETRHPNGEPGSWVILFESRSLAECRELALVLQALDISCRIIGEDVFTLLVPRTEAKRANAEIVSYLAEPRGPPPKPPSLPIQSSGIAGIVGYVAILLIFAFWQSHESLGIDWLASGRLDSTAVIGGQWWRSVTSLTLHLDLPHLSANLVFGTVFGYFAAQVFGTGIAWLSILVAGTAGNYLNAWLHGPGHRSVGASTAIFAALGLLAAFNWRRWKNPGESFLRRWSPILAGIALLAYTGAGGERTDVLAHLAGFVSGVGLGAFFGMAGPRIYLSAPAQRSLVMVTFFILILAWVLAIQSNTGRLI